MSTIVLVLAVLFACAIAYLGWWTYRKRPAPASIRRLPFISPLPRKMSGEERAAIERYFQLNKHLQHISPLTAPEPVAESLALTSRSATIYSGTHAITRYGLATDAPHKWRYYLDNTEVHLPPLWEQYITEDNYVELIKTDSIPLVIALNGHSLMDYVYAAPQATSPPAVVPNSSMREQGNEQVELIKIRKETPQEYLANRPGGKPEALIFSLALVVLFISLLAPVQVILWLVAIACLLMAWAGWHLYRRPPARVRQDIHCLRGTPKRWGLFGEADQAKSSNISLGSIDLIYPSHWLAFIEHDLGHKTDVDISINRQVVRQGRFLSLHEEMINFPLQRFGKNVIVLFSSLLLLVLLPVYVPLSLPLKLSTAWLQGAQTVQATNVATLQATRLRIGDTLQASGSGMCFVDTSPAFAARHPFMPFDCASIYWNDAAPLPVPESETVDRAEALLSAVTSQLHPAPVPDNRVNSGLASAIQKSGMILLDDFSDIVLKTQDLCEDDSASCQRLKLALVNLANGKDWPTIVKRAQNGSLKGINVLLRPVSAETLEELVSTTTGAYFSAETHRATNALNSPSPGGFLIHSDEAKLLVAHQEPVNNLQEFSGLDRWRELQRLSTLLLHTPFRAEGIITGLSVDANGTRHISLHSEPDMVSIWRYMGTSLLLVLLIGCALYNLVLLMRRVGSSRRRTQDIQRYYEHCFHPELSPIHRPAPH